MKRLDGSVGVKHLFESIAEINFLARRIGIPVLDWPANEERHPVLHIQGFRTRQEGESSVYSEGLQRDW